MIELFGVTKVFGDDVVALKDFTLKIDKAELVLLTGPSGAGKTTLLRTIFAAVRPDGGQVVIAGRNIARLRASSVPYLRRNIGVVFQDFKLLWNRTARENVAVPLEIRGASRREVRHKALEALTAVGLEGAADKVVSALSGGEQQRVAIARAVVGEPAILLADEPTGNLDPERSHDILELLDEISRQGTTVVLATHDPMVVQNAACTKIVRLEQGRVIDVTAGVRAAITPRRRAVDTLRDAADVEASEVPASDPPPASAPLQAARSAP